MAADGKGIADDRTMTSAGRSKPSAPASGAHTKSPQPGQKFGKYQIVKLLGQGGMGSVYEAVDSVLQRRIALKILPDQLAKDEAALKRFVREARAAAQLNHPNTVILYDVARRDETTYITMELVVGTTAQALVDQHGKMPVANATRIVSDICKGVSAAHKLNLVHRDIKPTNILVNREGVAKLSDFGLAKPVQTAGAGVTQDNTLLGTPNYMSPEQAEGKAVDARCDIYALGGTYHALLTGKPPYERATTVLLLYAHCHEAPPDPRTIVPDLPESCVRIIQKAMAKSPSDRYASADEMLADLQRVTGDRNDNTYALHEALNQIEAASPTVIQLPTANRPVPRNPVMSGAAIAGIVIGAAVLVLGVVIGVFVANHRGAQNHVAVNNANHGEHVSHPGGTPASSTKTDAGTGATALNAVPAETGGTSKTAGQTPTVPPAALPENPKPVDPQPSKPVESPKPPDPTVTPGPAKPVDPAAYPFASTGTTNQVSTTGVPPPATQPAIDEATQAIIKEFEAARDKIFKVKESNSPVVIENAFAGLRKFVDKYRDSTNQEVKLVLMEADRMLQHHREEVANRPGGNNTGGPQQGGPQQVGDRPKPPTPPSRPRGR